MCYYVRTLYMYLSDDSTLCSSAYRVVFHQGLGVFVLRCELAATHYSPLHPQKAFPRASNKEQAPLSITMDE